MEDNASMSREDRDIYFVLGLGLKIDVFVVVVVVVE